MKKNIVLVVSLAVGLLAAVLTRVYIVAKEAEVTGRLARLNARYGTIWALAYKRDVPVGTILTRQDLFLMEVPAMGLRGQALLEENVSDVVGRRTLLGHSAKEIVFWSDIEGGGNRVRGLSDDIKRQMRAISINCSGAASVSGMVHPNDHVDVIGTFSFPGEDGRVKSADIETRTILQNVLVLATGQTTAKTRLGSERTPFGQGYATVTLEVTPREAEIIAFTEQMKGRMILTLRNRNDTSCEKELPKVDFEKIKAELEQLNNDRQQRKLYGGR